MKKKRIHRPDWDEYFLGIAKLVSKRSTCLRRQVGAVIVKERHILATGYNGTPSGIVHCEVTGCLREKLKVPSGERHELCLLPNEDVLTSKGYAPIADIKIGERVLTHRGVYRKIIKLFKREYGGKLYYIEPWNLLPVALTPNHPVLVIRTKMCEFDKRTLCKQTCKSANKSYCNKPHLKYKLEWVPASELNEKDMVALLFDNRSYSIDEIDFSFVVDAPLEYYKVLEGRGNKKSYGALKQKLNIWPSTAYNWAQGGVPRDCTVVYDGELRHGSSQSKAIPHKVKLSPEFLRLIGFYLSEGCSSSNQVSFSFNKKEKEFIEEVKTTMKDIFNLDCYEDKRRNSHKLVYSSIILAKAFKTLFGGDAYTKRLPHFLIRLSPEQQKYILTSYVQGDGYKIDENTTTITTASKTLALQVMQILLRLSYMPMIDTGRNTYRLIWKDKFKISYGYLEDNIFFSPIRRILTKQYSGYVHNLEVETDNSYITKSFIVHNCRGLHGEQNALLQAAYHGISVKDSILYATTQPCIICAKMLINAGIREVVITSWYPDKMAKEFLDEAGITLRIIDKKKRV